MGLALETGKSGVRRMVTRKNKENEPKPEEKRVSIRNGILKIDDLVSANKLRLDQDALGGKSADRLLTLLTSLFEKNPDFNLQQIDLGDLFFTSSFETDELRVFLRDHNIELIGGSSNLDFFTEKDAATPIVEEKPAKPEPVKNSDKSSNSGVNTTIEKPPTSETPELTPELRNLQKVTKEMAQRYRKMGIPVTNSGRVDMDAYTDVYSAEVVEADQQYAKNLELKQQGKNLSDDELLSISSSEQFERLVSYILTKFAGNRLVVVRSSKFDDVTNGVDTIIVDRISGLDLCTIDEVTNNVRMADTNIDDKRKKVAQQNKTGSAVKYGFDLYKETDTSRKSSDVHQTTLNTLPSLYLSISNTALDHTLREMSSSLKDKNNKQEQDIFIYIVSALRLSIEQLDLHKKTELVPFSNRLEKLEQTLDKLEEIAEKF